MFIEELDRPCYALRDKRGFFDKELPIDQSLLDVLKAIDEKAQLAQVFLRVVYTGGDAPKIEVPEWLEKEASALRHAKPATDQGSNKTLRLNSKPTASSSSTKQPG